jgi:hypothetical protein
MWIVALQAVANCRAVDRPLDFRCVLVRVAREADAHGRSSNQLYTSDVSVDPDFVTNITSEGNRGMDYRTLGFVLVALGAFCRINLFIERDWVNIG